MNRTRRGRHLSRHRHGGLPALAPNEVVTRGLGRCDGGCRPAREPAWSAWEERMEGLGQRLSTELSRHPGGWNGRVEDQGMRTVYRILDLFTCCSRTVFSRTVLSLYYRYIFGFRIDFVWMLSRRRPPLGDPLRHVGHCTVLCALDLCASRPFPNEQI